MRKCISSFATADGKVIAAGEFVEDNDPVVKGHEVFFAGVSDPVKAPDLGVDEEGDTVPDNTNKPEPTRTPNVNGINPPDPDPVDDDDPRLRKDEDTDRDEDDDDEGERSSRHPSEPVRVEEATAEPGVRRATGRGSDRK